MSTKDIHENHEPAPPLGLGSSEGLGRMSPTATQDIARAVRLFGVTAEQATKALQAFSVAAKKLEDESKALMEAHRARQPWWRRGRW